MLAVILYIILILSLMQNWLWFTFLLAVVFSFRYTAIPLIPVAILLDGYYGNFHTVPYLSLIAVGWFIVVELLQPKLVNVRSV